MVILPNLTYWLGISEVYAVVVTVAFLITGFLLDNWHPGWMLFLTIPLYYVLIFGTLKMEFPQGGNSIFCTLLVDNRAGAARHAVLGLFQKGVRAVRPGALLGDSTASLRLGSWSRGRDAPFL